MSRPDGNKALAPHPTIPRSQGPLLICILDGYGEGPFKDEYNAIYRANTPCMDGLLATTAQRRCRLLKAHGDAVGLPPDDMGNSEVGHNALGSGQIVDQGAKCVDRALKTGSVFEGEGWRCIEPAAVGKTLHLIGLLSDGGIHSRYDQLEALLHGAINRGARRVRLHVLSDGRDVHDGTAVEWLERLQRDLQALEQACAGLDAKIASGGGRMKVTMDRYESDWSIVKRGWDAHVLGQAPNRFQDILKGVASLQHKDGEFVSDQQLEPWVAISAETNQPVGPICDGDAVILFNFRADRVIELSKAFEYGDEFTAFDRGRRPNVRFAGMMQYDGELHIPRHFLVPPPLIERASEEYLVASGIRIFACSESQKMGHVTFFWNGNRSGVIDPKLQTFKEIPSDQGISFDKRPAMKAHEIAATAKEALLSGQYDVVRINFPNPDMVGHTGNLKATIEACEVTDTCVAELLDAVQHAHGRFLITADHGNAEDMAQRNKKTGQVARNPATGDPLTLTSHTTNPVPCAIGGPDLPSNVRFRSDLPKAGLANVTASYINLLGLTAPEFYQPSLIEASPEEQ